ncbi:MAG TPA: DUF1512 domain-containing protein [Candidatus Acidoferrales bacterium]|nr:DUF1512 domain-containing protein [Candidatus Acidoferrales bacterium]
MLPPLVSIVLENGPGLFGQNLFTNLINIVWVGSFIALFLFGQQIQSRLALMQIDGAVRKLENMKNDAKSLTIKTLRDVGKAKDDPTPRLNTLLEQFLIEPVSMDPAGVVNKFDHLLDVREAKFKSDVARIAPEANPSQVNNLENLVEAAWALNYMFKIVRHLYLLGKKTFSILVIFQLQAFLPLIMQEAEAYTGASKAFAEGHPIGDGAGPLVANKLMRGHESRKVEKDMVAAETMVEGRRVIALKAEGPGGNVGKPGDAIRQVLEENNGKAAMIIMVDAALKLEGERTGEVAEGIGAAIGGIGTERFKIEEEATKFGVPVYAIVIKQSILEAVTTMKKEIAEAVDPAIEKIKRLILETTKEGELVIIAGIGNTAGIAP